jgi:hypothetical protein
MWFIFLRGWTGAEIERAIRAEVKEGSNRQSLEMWFQTHGIPHKYFEGPDHAKFNNDVAKSAGLQGTEISGVLQGFIDMEHSNEHFLLPSEIFIYFFFDSDGRLLGHFVDPAVYGP